MPRFVILHHETPPESERPPHWDLMLEQEGALRTWALVEPLPAGVEIAAEALPLHRLDYLEYEGEISKGRGTVRRCDAGEYLLEHEQPQRLDVVLRGARWRGRLTLERGDDDKTERWTARFIED